MSMQPEELKQQLEQYRQRLASLPSTKPSSTSSITGHAVEDNPANLRHIGSVLEMVLPGLRVPSFAPKSPPTAVASNQGVRQVLESLSRRLKVFVYRATYWYVEQRAEEQQQMNIILCQAVQILSTDVERLQRRVELLEQQLEAERK